MAKKVLVIDDNADIRENTAEILDMAGYDAITAANGKEGVDMAVEQKPDIIVCDIMMPELDGFGVLHLVRKNASLQNTPFIFLTAKTERSDFRKGMEMGADDYLTKPFTQIELLNAVETRLKKVEILRSEYASSSQGVYDFINDVKKAGLLEHIANRYEVTSFVKKQILYSEGKRPKYLFYLEKGKVKSYKMHEDGKEYITDLYNTGDFIGYAALIEDKNYDDTAIVIDNAEIMLVPREDFLQLIYTDPSIATRFIKMITKNVKAKEERMMNLAYSTLRRRVAMALIEIYHKFQNASTPGSVLEITREDVAHYVGTATESLIRTITDFKSEGIVDIISGKIRINNISKLENLYY